MNTSRAALIAAVTSVIAFAGKAVSIGLADGRDGGPAEILFLIGFIAHIVAVITVALALSRRRRLAVRVAAAIAGPVAAMAVVGVVQAIVQRVQPLDPSWVWGEVNLWVTSGLVLALAVRAYLSTSPTTKNVEPRIATMSDTSVPGSSSVST